LRKNGLAGCTRRVLLIRIVCPIDVSSVTLRGFGCKPFMAKDLRAFIL